jgi:hypothetical protein
MRAIKMVAAAAVVATDEVEENEGSDAFISSWGLF